MQLTLSATGTPQNVTQAINQQTRQARVEPNANHAFIVGLRDAALNELKGVPADATVAITATASITSKVTEVQKAPAAAPVADKSDSTK